MAMGWTDIDDLPKNAANYTALTPLWFLERAAMVHPTRKAVIYGSKEYTWHQTYERCRRLASALSNHLIGSGSTVAVIAPNIPAMYEAHFGIPMSGGVINPINIRLNAITVAFLLTHSQSKAVIVDQEFYPLVEQSLKLIPSSKKSPKPLVIVVQDETCDPKGFHYAMDKKCVISYEEFLESGDPLFAWEGPEDEWKSIGLGYTSGTTDSPKGVVLHHRGAYLMALSGALVWGMRDADVYLWTLPMFHCNGWCYTWTLAALCGTNICLRQVTANAIYSAIANHNVTHFCAAPVVLNTIVNAPPEDTILPLPSAVNVMTAGSSPPPSLLLSMTRLGFQVTHTYGLSETYGPSVISAWKPDYDAAAPETQAQLKSRQGVRYIGMEHLDVIDTRTGNPVPADGKTIGEIVMRGNTVMKGYLKNPKCNAEAFADGWFHSGDLAVKHPDDYVEIKDRCKDIIISGGENISSLEIEKVLYEYDGVLEASVVARPDERWQESPCAFVTVKKGVCCELEEEDGFKEGLVKFCRLKLPAYWVPKSVVFGPLPKTATGKVRKNLLREKAKDMGPVLMSKFCDCKFNGGNGNGNGNGNGGVGVGVGAGKV